MTLEHAPPHRRGFFTSFTLSGTQAGQILATAVFLPIAALPEEQLLSLGLARPVLAERRRRRRRATSSAARSRRRRSSQQEQRAPTTSPSCRSSVLLRDHWADVLRVVAGRR